MSSTAGHGLPEFAGRYRLGQVVGTGGFAVVVRAFDEALAADVAIKVLDGRRALDPEVRERFIREARLLRRVRSPNVIGVHDVGETEEGLPYFVMDLASGTLEDRLAGPVPAGEIARIAATLTAGLGALHAAGVIHRDVKPSNLLILGPPEGRSGGGLLAPGEELVLGDLGLAKDQEATAYGPTMLGGTPLYRAPEQMELGAQIDERTDVYASTAVLWRLLTGGPPPTPEELEIQLLGAPDAWRRVLARGMALRPEERFVSMAAWGAEVAALLGAGSGAPQSTGVRAAAAGATCPYKGLAAFQASDAALFFGRGRLVDELVTRLHTHPMLVIGGPSGSGKSSLMRAGLLPALAQGGLPGSQNWHQVVMSPGPHPLRMLEEKLGAVAGPLVLAVDQFEESFTACEDAGERRAFLERLESLATSDPPDAAIVIALRADFYGVCAAEPMLAAAINTNQLLVGPMARSQLREAVEGPARRVGLRLEEGLVDRILDDTGNDTGALPLLSHALVETWMRRKGSTMTIAGYEAAGGVAGAIGRSAEDLWRRLGDAERTVARRIFLRLVRSGDGGTPDTRRLATREELGDDEVTDRVVAALAEVRLVTVDERGVELAHEALLGSWGRLAGWIDESRDQMRAAERVETAAREWERQDRDPDALYRGSQLTAALEWQQGLEQPAGEPSASFLAAARDARENEERSRAQTAARRTATRRRVLAALSGLAALAVLTSVVALVAYGRSERNARAAGEQLARNLAATALQSANDDPYLATVLAAEALARVEPPLPEAREALVAARRALGGRRPVPYGDPLRVGDALTLAVDPSGSQAVTGQRNGDLVLWDLDRRRELARTSGPKGGVQKVALSPNGRWAIAGDGDGTLWRWDLGSKPGPAKPLRDLGSVLWSVAIGPDGKLVAVATEGGEVWLLDAATGEPQGDAVGRNTGGFTSVALSSDGSALLAGDGTGAVNAWSLPTRQSLFPPVQAHTSDVWELAVDPPNRRFLTVSSDGQSRLWDLATGTRLPGGPQDGSSAAPTGLMGATFGPSGEIVMGGPDGKVYSWSVDEQRLVDVTGTAQGGRITDTARSQDGTRLVTLGADQTLRVWDQSDRPGESTRVASLGRPLFSIVAAGSRVAVGGDGGQVLVVDAATGEVERTVAGLRGRVFSMVAAGLNRVIAGDQEGNLKLIDLAEGKVVRTVEGAFGGPVPDLARSEDGTVAAVGSDGVLKLMSNGLELRKASQPRSTPFTSVAFAGDGLVTTDPSGRAIRWDLDLEPVGEPLQATGSALWSAAGTASGVLALAGDDEVVYLWSDSGRGLELAPHRGGALDVVFLDDSVVAATTRDGRVRLWDTGLGRSLGVLEIDDGSPIWHLFAGGDGTIWAADEAGTVARIDGLVPARACALAAASFDDAQKARLLGGEELQGCKSVGGRR